MTSIRRNAPSLPLTTQRHHDLSPAEQRLLRLLQRINYGRIRNLVIQDGMPSFDPPPQVQRDRKFSGHNGPRTEAQLQDFALKKEVAEMFRSFRELGQGRIVNLEIRAGLPVIMTEEAAA